MIFPWRIEEHTSLPSTQDAAIAAAHANDPGRLAILADTQTNGRGSRGRTWTSPPGNLNLSILIRPETPIPPGHIALLAGIALHDALTPYTRNLMLKWPNDLLLDGAKLAGILVDATFTATGTPAWFVIGIGANLAHAPNIPGRQTASLPAPAPSPKAVAEAILNALDTTQDITAEWLKRAHPPGTYLHIQTPQRSIEGTFETITNEGALKLNEHFQPISSGEVLLGLCPRPRGGLGVYAEAIPPDPQHFRQAQPCFS